MINIGTYIFFGLFFATFISELVASFREDDKLRKIIKPLPMFFLTIAVVFALPTHPLIYLGALLGMIGDILLLDNKKRTKFLLGTIFFLLGHIFYISEVLFVLKISRYLDWWFYIIVAFSMLLVTLAAYPTSKRLTKDRYLALFGNIYLCCLILVTVVSLIASFNGFVDYMILGVIGGVSFLASDLILTKATFIQDFKRRDYYIMLFYLLGQVAIISALTLTSVL